MFGHIINGSVLVINNGIILQWMKRPSYEKDKLYTLTLVVTLKKLYWLSDIGAFTDTSNYSDTGCSYKANSFTGGSIGLVHDTYKDQYGYIAIIGS